ncbi:hypothetical protein ABZ192_11650 [Streptomyces sp. NPDC006235]|uniref:hypothetical protein n=1 Tax=Streptomyces sp. NPDC006235 TaxID=3156736 RepID=UPI0033A22EBC
MDGPNEGLFLHHLPGYRSPPPPVRADLTRSNADLPRQYARWLEDSPHGPLYDARRLLGPRCVFPPYV